MYKKILIKKNCKLDNFDGFFEGFIISKKNITKIKNFIKSKNENILLQDAIINVIKNNYNLVGVFKYMEISEKYRGNSIGHNMLNEFIDICENDCVDLIIIIADNINDKVTIDEHLNKDFNVTNFYENYGFKKVRKLEKNKNLLIYPELIADEFSKLLKREYSK